MQFEQIIEKPMYKQVKEYLEKIIDNSNDGEFLPSENELSKIFDVSRITIRSATKELEIEGKVTKQKGKGTFVSKKENNNFFKLERSTECLLSWEEEMERLGVSPSSLFTKLESCHLPKDLKEKFNLKWDKTFMLKRIKRINNIKFLLINYFNPDHIKGLSVNELAKESIYNILAKKYNYEVFRAEEVVEAKVPTKEESTILNLDDGEALFSLTRISYTENNICLGIGKVIVNGKHYQYSSKIFRKNK